MKRRERQQRMTPQEKLENFICDKDAFKKWWNAATDVTGDEHTAWLAWRAAIIHAEIENAKATPTADTGLAREIAERLVKWQMETGKFLTARSGERAPVIPQSVLERELQDALSTTNRRIELRRKNKNYNYP